MLLRQQAASAFGRRVGSLLLIFGIGLASTACNSRHGGDDGSGSGSGAGTGVGNSTPSLADTTPPTVVNATPNGSAAGLEPTISVSVEFSETIDPASIGASNFWLVGPYGPIAATISINNGIVTLTPNQPLPTNATITATISGARDMAGNVLGGSYTWSFTIRSFTPAIGSSATDEAYGVAVGNNGTLYLAGYTNGAYAGQTNAGLSDIALLSFDAAGNSRWNRQLGDTHEDRARAVATDGAGNVVTTGFTKGALGSDPYAGLADVTLIKHDASGALQWVRQIGTAAWDEALGIAIDANGASVVVGQTDGDLAGTGYAGGTDAFIVKYDATGSLLWRRQHGSANEDVANAVTTDAAGNIYVAGFSRGDLDGNLNTNSGWADLFLIKYDAAGNHQWTRLYGTIVTDKGTAITLDSAGDIYITGATVDTLDGIPNAGGFDVFVVKYDGAGNRLWTRQFGSTADDFAYGITADANGNIYFTGSTAGNLDGNTNSGAEDIFVTKYSAAGNRIWTRTLGTTGSDVARAITKDRANPYLYVVGHTSGALDGQPNMGGNDMFAIRFDIDGNKR